MLFRCQFIFFSFSCYRIKKGGHICAQLGWQEKWRFTVILSHIVQCKLTSTEEYDSKCTAVNCHLSCDQDAYLSHDQGGSRSKLFQLFASMAQYTKMYQKFCIPRLFCAQIREQFILQFFKTIPYMNVTRLCDILSSMWKLNPFQPPQTT